MLKKLFPFAVALLFSSMTFAQAPRLVLFEEFTGENCGPCAGTNPYVQTLINAYPSSVLWVRYQCNIPTPGTIYYQDQTDVDTRLNYYGVSSAPWGQQDGFMWDSSLVSNWGNQPITWCADTNTGALNTVYLDNEKTVVSPFTIAVDYHLSVNADSFYTTVTVTGSESYKVSLTGKLKLRVAMLENLSFNTPPGDNGETQFPDVVRKMYPSAAGTALPDSSYNGLIQTFNFSGKIPAYIYDKSQLRFVAFVQDDNTMHVQQAGVSLYDTLALDAKAVAVQGNYLVCNTPYQTSFNFTNNGNQTLTSAQIEIKLDGTLVDTINWTGTLAPGAVGTVNVPALSPATGAHSIIAIVTKPNGVADANPGNDSSSLNFAIAATAANLPLVEGFESANMPGWFVQDPSGSAFTWARASYGDSSTYSYSMDFYDASFGAINNLYVPTLNFSGVNSPRLKFSRADAQYDFGASGGGLSQDSLYINASTDCGNTWTTLYANGGTTMATVAADANLYTPVQADWVNDTVDLSAVANNPNVILQFNAVSGNGNVLYIDNINIFNAAPVGIKTVANINALSVFPNPANDLLNVHLQLTQSAEVSFEVTNTLGQVITTGPAEMQSAGNSSLIIHTDKLSSGAYFLSVISGMERTSKLFTVIR